MKIGQDGTYVVSGYRRLNNSKNGNPRYVVHFTNGGYFLTQSDASCAYDIPNMQGKTVVMDITRGERISGIREIPSTVGDMVRIGQYVNGLRVVAVAESKDSRKAYAMLTDGFTYAILHVSDNVVRNHTNMPTQAWQEFLDFVA